MQIRNDCGVNRRGRPRHQVCHLKTGSDPLEYDECRSPSVPHRRNPSSTDPLLLEQIESCESAVTDYFARRPTPGSAGSGA